MTTPREWIRLILQGSALYCGLFLYTYFLISLAATVSPSQTKTLPGMRDWRLSGVAQSGWTAERFGFTEPRIAPWSAMVQFTFDTVRPQHAGPAHVLFDSRLSEPYAVTISREPVRFHVAKDSPIQINATVQNPFAAPGDPSSQLGVKVASVSLIPRFFVLVPAWNFAISLIAFIVALSLIVTVLGVRAFPAYSLRWVSWIPLFLSPALISLTLANSIYDQWSRSEWLWGFLLLVALGCSLGFSGAKRWLHSLEGSAWRLSPIALCVSILVIFGFALWVRVTAVSFGLPQLYHPDEARKLRISQRMVETGDLDPRYFRHPSFLLYATAALGEVRQIQTNSLPSIQELAPLGRSVSAVLGALSVLVLYRIGAVLIGPLAGLLAAGVLTVSPLHVVCSRYIKEDVGMMFFSLLSLACVVQFLYRDARYRWIILSALCAGLASSVKYTGVLSFIFPLVPFGAWVLCRLRILLQSGEATALSTISWKKVYFWIPVIAGIGIGAFLCITPYSILNYTQFVEDFTAEKAHVSRGHAGAISGWAYFWTYHLRFSVIGSVSNPLGWASVFALGYIISRGIRTIPVLLVLGGFLLFYLPAEYVNAKPFPQPERYILPCIPFMGLALGWLMQDIFQALFQVRGSKSQERSQASFAYSLAAVSLVGLIIVYPALYSVRHRDHALQDTRWLATQWVNTHLPKGAKILTDWYFYGPDFRHDFFTVVQLKGPDKGPQLLRRFSKKMLMDEGFDYYVTSSFFYHRYLRQVQRGNEISRGYQELFESLKPIKVFQNPRYKYGFHNPTIKIFQLR